MKFDITWRKGALTVIGLGLAAGCASNGKKVGLRSEQMGAYHFTEHVSEDVILEGIFVVEPDTVSIEATPGPCRYERDQSNVLVISYTCGDVFYVFDRTDPLRTSRYSAVVHQRETRTVCVRYTVITSGQQVCAEWRNETFYRDVRRGGLLRPQRVSDDDPTHP